MPKSKQKLIYKKLQMVDQKQKWILASNVLVENKLNTYLNFLGFELTLRFRFCTGKPDDAFWLLVVIIGFVSTPLRSTAIQSARITRA